MLIKRCECGRVFETGSNRGTWCPECKAKRVRESYARYNAKRKRGSNDGAANPNDGAELPSRRDRSAALRAGYVPRGKRRKRPNAG